MTFLCLSTFLSLVFQQDAQSLLGEKRIEYLFCGTSEKWSPKNLTSTAFGDITKCHQGISHLLRQIKQRLASVAHLTAAIQTSKISLFPTFTRQFALCWVPSGSMPPAAVAPAAFEKKGPKSWINVTVTLRPGTALARRWGKDALRLLLPSSSRLQALQCFCTKFCFHYYT